MIPGYALDKTVSLRVDPPSLKRMKQFGTVIARTFGPSLEADAVHCSRSVPLALVSIDESDSKVVNKSLLLDQREMHIPLDTSKPFKLNAGTSGFYRVLYTPERLRSIGTTAAKDETVFDIADRMGLIYDASALARAGFSKMSDALSLINSFSEEKECQC